jgi:hypothetical protein
MPSIWTQLSSACFAVVCLAVTGASAAEQPTCAARDIEIITLIEDHGAPTTSRRKSWRKRAWPRSTLASLAQLIAKPKDWRSMATSFAHSVRSSRGPHNNRARAFFPVLLAKVGATFAA